MATIALFLTFGYWNDWFQSSLYISDTKLYSLQALLDHVQRNIEVMANNPSLGVTTAQYMNSMPKEGARMAMAIIIIIPIACCYPFFQKYCFFLCSNASRHLPHAQDDADPPAEADGNRRTGCEDTSRIPPGH